MGKKQKTTTHRILIVEDEVIEAMFLAKLLELWGYEVCELTAFGEDAIKEAEMKKPDLVLMDISIHGELSGLEAADKIHTQFGIPIIFMTGYSDEETRQEADAVLPAGYFIKPLNYDRLKETIEMVVHQKKPATGN
jgi:CheY-like chemotaxis protein